MSYASSIQISQCLRMIHKISLSSFRNHWHCCHKHFQDKQNFIASRMSKHCVESIESQIISIQMMEFVSVHNTTMLLLPMECVNKHGSYLKSMWLIKGVYLFVFQLSIDIYIFCLLGTFSPWNISHEWIRPDSFIPNLISWIWNA